MKNSPDPEWFHKLEERLGDYVEDPDADLFDRITAQTGKLDDPVWVPWANRSAVVVSVFLFLWSGTKGINAGRELNVDPVAPIESLSENERSSLQAADSADGQGPTRQTRVDDDETFSGETSSQRVVQLQRNDRDHVNDPSDQAESKKKISGSLYNQGKTAPNDFKENVRADSSASAARILGSPDPDERKGTIIRDRKKRMFTLYASISPSLSFQKITPLAGDGFVVDRFNSSPVFSEDRSGVSLQAGIQTKIANRFEVYGGLTLYRQAQVLIYHYQSGEHGENRQLEAFDYALTPGTTEQQVTYNMLNVGADAGMLYYLKGDRLAHKIGAGLSFQHGMRKFSEGETYDNANSQYLSYQIFYRNEYEVNNFIGIFIQPFYRHTLISKEALEERFTVRPYYAGLSFGVLYNFR